MMKIIAVLSVIIAAALCAPQQYAQNPVEILKYNNENDGSGNYRFEYELSDGQQREETGSLKEVQGEGADGPAQVVIMTGSYKFTDPEGKEHTVTYTADENGFHPIVSK